MHRLIIYFLTGSALLAGNTSLFGQSFVEGLTNIFEFDLNRRAVVADSSIFPTKLVLAPIVTYEPATNFGFGVGAKFLFKPPGAGPETRTSNLPLSVLYTLNSQIILYSGFTVFFPEEKYLLKGNLSYSRFPLGYYGRGPETSESDRVEIEFDNILIEPLILRRVLPNFFVGGGWRYNTFRNTELIEPTGNLPAGASLQDSIGSTSSGVEVAATYDSRDNVLNASEGVFAELTHGFYDESLGSTRSFMLSKINYRHYFRPFDQRADVIAVEVYSRIAWGDAPPLELSSLGGAEFLRGFQEGRFRDEVAFFGQVEYRWQAFGRIGFVFFAGAGDVTNRQFVVRSNNLKYSLGTGFRLKIVKSENLNIRFDYAFGLGPAPDNNFYLGIAEAF